MRLGTQPVPIQACHECASKEGPSYGEHPRLAGRLTPILVLGSSVATGPSSVDGLAAPGHSQCDTGAAAGANSIDAPTFPDSGSRATNRRRSSPIRVMTPSM